MSGGDLADMKIYVLYPCIVWFHVGQNWSDLGPGTIGADCQVEDRFSMLAKVELNLILTF